MRLFATEDATSRMESVAFAPDGRFVAAVGRGKRVWLDVWDTAGTAAPVRSVADRDAAPAFTADGSDRLYHDRFGSDRVNLAAGGTGIDATPAGFRPTALAADGRVAVGTVTDPEAGAADLLAGRPAGRGKSPGGSGCVTARPTGGATRG